PGGKLLAPMNGTGRVVLSDKSVKRLVISLNSGDGVPSTYALRENYPNPFNPTTTIGYDVPEEQRVKLAVYNVLGQLVATLVDEERSAGRYSVTWDAGGMPSGVYFCRMEAGNFADTRKMVILK
ncbi:MAG TPA: T9SS type A sorting domain-containing protein, partial [Bacteroidota bacterium]|nr:T9SS type A sorting domain-containing protein [Bacteroidota bacterium]